MNRFEEYAEVKEKEILAKYTSFKIGGPAKFALFPKDEESFINILKICKEEQLNYMIIGNGTNILINDEGYDGVAIILKNRLNSIEINGNTIVAGAGAGMREVANSAYNAGLSGMEFAHGIPGSIGGGAIMNAGAYGGELKDIVQSVRLLDENFNIIEYTNEEMKFCYRNSIAQEKKYIVLSVKFKLQKGEKSEIKEKMEDFMQRRMSKQPLDMPSAGSTFRRPEGYYAGKLIEDSGLRGFTHGGASVSEKHCGFVVNKNSATAKDVKELIETVRKIVKDKYGVTLEREVRYVGDK